MRFGSYVASLTHVLLKIQAAGDDHSLGLDNRYGRYTMKLQCCKCLRIREDGAWQERRKLPFERITYAYCPICVLERGIANRSAHSTSVAADLHAVQM